MKPALLRLALTLLAFILGCRATAIPDAALAASPAVGAGVRPRSGRTATVDHSGGAPAGYFASTTGSATGKGTAGDPWTLTQALLGGYPTNTVQPGDTVWIRGGTYVGKFTCSLRGTITGPITFRAYPGERATIDSQTDPSVENEIPIIQMTQNGSYLRFQDLEVTNSNMDRWCNPAQTNERATAFQLSAPHSKIINCIIDDMVNSALPSEYFDIVSCVEVIEHVQKRPGVHSAGTQGS